MRFDCPKDEEVSRILAEEKRRQQEELILIASENYTSPAVLSAQASVMTNKYAEGYPGSRYYHGCEYVDEMENLAVARAKKLFGAEHVNVQPHSGCQANMAVYYAFLSPGDAILAMNLAEGGHLTHGTRMNFSGRWYKPFFYGLNRETEMIDPDQILKLAKKHRPKLIMAGASSYPRKIDYRKFREIADETGAYLVADIAHVAGLIAAGLHPDPLPYADAVTTTTHKTLRGPRSAMIMCKAEHAEKIDRAVFPGVQSGPFMHTIAAKAVAFGEALREDFGLYQKQVLANASLLAGLLSGEGFRIVSGGTDNHLFLVDLSGKISSGSEAADILYESGITVNKNSIPFDPNPPALAGGIRLGTPAVTTRGMREEQMKIIARMISRLLSSPENPSLRKSTRREALALCRDFPVYDEL